MKISVIIVAAGQGSRMGAGFNKVYLTLNGKTILENTISVFEKAKIVDEIVVVTDDIETCKSYTKGFFKITEIVLGGKTRRDSVINGLNAVTGDIVAIHDGARALITEDDVTRVIEDAKKYGATALGVKCKDTLKKIDGAGFISETVNRDTIYNIQTPQVFKSDEIRKFHSLSNGEFTDDCSVAESFGIKIKLTEGSYDNIKITTPDDLWVAENILKRRQK